MACCWDDCYIGIMSEELDTLIAHLSALPDGERKQWLDRFTRELEQGQELYCLSDKERRLVREGLSDLDAGRIVPLSEMEAFWQRNHAR